MIERQGFRPEPGQTMAEAAQKMLDRIRGTQARRSPIERGFQPRPGQTMAEAAQEMMDRIRGVKVRINS